MRAGVTIRLVLLFALAAGLVAVRLFIGRDLDGGLLFEWPEEAIVRLRATAAGAALLVGAALATAGLLLQVLLRNVLASPYILGVSSGSALGVVTLGAFGGAAATGLGVDVAAIVGGLAVLGVVYALGQRRGLVDPMSILLIGVVMSMICAALIMLIQHLSPDQRADLVTWMMGYIPEYKPLATLAPTVVAVIAGVAFTIRIGPTLDLASLSDDEARTSGVRLGSLRAGMFVIAGVLTAVSVGVAGPIGFVGLIAPHMARLVLGPNHRPLAVGAACLGAATVLGADIVRQVIDLGAGRLPVGVVTALVGGPMFIWMFRSGRDAA